MIAQADHINWTFRGGYYGNNIDILVGPGPEPAGLDVAKLPYTGARARLQSIVLGDLDNDGDLDFISGSQAGTLHYFENQGSRTAPNWVAASIPTLDTILIDRTLTVRNQNRPQLVDIDDDGDLDLFVGTDFDYNTNRSNDVLFYRNIGTVEAPVFEYIPENLPGLHNQEVCEFPGLGFVDIDNDGDFDIIMMGSDTLTYFKNIGSKSNPIFERQSEADSPWDSSTVAAANMDVPIPVFEDFDRDGDYDMFFMADSGIVFWIENTGTKENAYFGTTQRTMNGGLENTVIGSFPVVDFGDVDGDGLKDAVFGTFNVPRFSWFRQEPVCILPEVPIITATPVSCEGETSTITISGNLNIASKWAIYTDSCGGNLIGAPTTNTSTFEVIPSAPSTTYYIRPEDGDIGCLDESVTTCFLITINVTELDDASFNYNETQYCKDAENPTPIITGIEGGEFTSSAGLIIDSDTGIIDLQNSIAGEHTVRYTTNGTCSNFSEVTLTIAALDDAGFNYNELQYCKDAENPTPTITGLTGGIFTSEAGLTIDSVTGIIDLENSIEGEYIIRYTTQGTCTNFSEITLTVIALDDAGFNYNELQYCKDAENPTPIITGIEGGEFTSSAGLVIDSDTGIIDLQNSIAGEHTIRYTTNGTCSNFSEVTLTIAALDDAGFNYNELQYCKDAENPIPIITGLTGGIFTNSTGLSIDPETGEINPENSPAGEHIIRYTTNGTCINLSEVTISIREIDDATFSYNNSIYCKDASNPTPTISGLMGGQFTSTVGLSIDSGTGIIDINNSVPGEYNIIYSTNGTCPNSSMFAITILDTNNPDVSQDYMEYSIDGANPSSIVSGEVIIVPEGVNLEMHVPETSMERTVIWTAPNNQTYTTDSVLLQNLRDGLDLEGEWSLHIIFDNSCSLADQTITFDIEVDPALSVPDLDTDDLVIYPNPFQSSINVQSPVDLSEVNIEIVDISGRKVFSHLKKDSSENTIIIDLNYLSKGIYFLVLQQEDHSVVKRIVKQ